MKLERLEMSLVMLRKELNMKKVNMKELHMKELHIKKLNMKEDQAEIGEEKKVKEIVRMHGSTETRKHGSM